MGYIPCRGYVQAPDWCQYEAYKSKLQRKYNKNIRRPKSLIPSKSVKDQEKAGEEKKDKKAIDNDDE